jgi:hypothetical protein
MRGDQVRHHLGVGFAGELGAGRLELVPQLGEVLDDAVVDHRHPPGGVGVRVRIAVVGRTVGGPPGMAHPSATVERAGREFAGDVFLEVLESSRLLGDLQATPVDNGDAGGVVAAVLQAAQSLDDDVERRAVADVAHDAAHGIQGNGVLESVGPAPAIVDEVVGAADGVAVTVGIAVSVTAGAVCVTVGVVTTTDGVTVVVTVGAGATPPPAACWVLPNKLVPLPESPRTTSLMGRPATTSTPVTTARTSASTAAEPSAAARQGLRSAALRSRCRVECNEWLITAVPTAPTTLASAAPTTVPATPK